MTKTTTGITKSIPKELPPGWEWAHRDKRTPSFRAEKAWSNLRTMPFPTEGEAILAAYEIEKANEEGLLGIAGRGLVSPSEKANGVDEPSLEKALHSALHRVQGAAERWKVLQKFGSTDADLMSAISNEFGLGGGSTDHGEYKYKGGKSPQFTWFDDGPLHKAQKLTGKRLLAKAREVLSIGAPHVHDDVHAAVEEAMQAVHRSEEPVEKRVCRVCGCTTLDCRQCIEKTGEPCHWVEPDLCSACFEPPAVAMLRSLDTAPASANDYHPQMLRMIPIAHIVPSQTNPRKYFDPDKLRELADSIIEHGLVEPILVRPTTLDPIPGGEYDDESFNIQYFELVAGERRWRATKLAGLTVIEAKVRDLDDQAALEIQMIENLQRDDLNPMEEADGYAAMLNLTKEDGTSVYTVDTLAARIGKKGKSKSYVYGRLKLRNLPPLAMDAIAKGDLPATIAEMIGRLPSMEMRQEFWDEWFEFYGREDFEMPSFREVRETIERNYMRELKKAPWNRKDVKLVPDAGACINCPKMTGNNRAEFPDGRADMCTDVPCFERKLKAHYERQVGKAEKSGARVLCEADSVKLFNRAGDSVWLSSEAHNKYVELKDQPYWDKEKRSYKQLLDGHVETVVAISPQGEPYYFAPRAEAERVLAEVHGLKSETYHARSDHKTSMKKAQDEKKNRQAAAAEVVTRALACPIHSYFEDDAFLRLIAKFLISEGNADVARAIAKRREIEYNPNHVRGWVSKFVDSVDDAQIHGLIVEWLIQRELEAWACWGSDRDDRFPLCDYFELKPKAVMREVAAKRKQEAKEKAKAKTKPKAKAAATA